MIVRMFPHFFLHGYLLTFNEISFLLQLVAPFLLLAYYSTLRVIPQREKLRLAFQFFVVFCFLTHLEKHFISRIL